MSQHKTLTNFEKGKSLLEIRDRLNLTQKAMADLLGLDSTYLSQLENGHRAVSDHYLIKATEIEKSKKVQTFHEHSGKRQIEGSPFPHMELSTLDNTLLDLARRLQKSSPHERKHILGNIVDLVGELEQREINSLSPDAAARQVVKLASQVPEKPPVPLPHK